MTTSEPTVTEALQTRHSSRSFLDKPVEEDKLALILQAGQWTASGNNSQPWKFIVVREPGAKARLLDALHPGNKAWAQLAPMLLVVCARPEDSRYHDRDGKQYYLYECGLAVQNIVIQATGLGLMAHQMGNFEEASVQEALGVPPEYRIVIVMAVGYEGPWDILPEEVKARGDHPRERRHLSEMAFYDGWPESVRPS